MKYLYCWRCKIDVPMLDEQEYHEVYARYHEALIATKELLSNSQEPVERTPLTDFYSYYENIIGIKRTEFAKRCSFVIHHVLAKYGPTCKNCGKPLRTATATSCVACGTARPDDQPSSF